MFHAKKTQETAYPKRFSQLQQTDIEKTAFVNWRASDKCGNKEILPGASSSFTAPNLNIGYAACQRFCFSPVISLNNLNDLNLKIIEPQSLNGLSGANRRALGHLHKMFRFPSPSPLVKVGRSVGQKKPNIWRGLGASKGRAAKPVVSAPNAVTASPGKKKKKTWFQLRVKTKGAFL